MYGMSVTYVCYVCVLRMCVKLYTLYMHVAHVRMLHVYARTYVGRWVGSLVGRWVGRWVGTIYTLCIVYTYENVVLWLYCHSWTNPQDDGLLTAACGERQALHQLASDPIAMVYVWFTYG